MKIFQLNWTAPSNNGGATITDYIVQYSSDGQTWTTYNDGTSNLTNTTIAGLTECSSYQFRVAAVNSAGTGPYSSTASAYLALPPEAVSNINATYNGQDDVELTWSAPNDKGCSISDYVIQYSNNNGSSWTTVSDGIGTGTTHTIQNLPVGTYVFRVAAVNVGGTGTYGQYSSNITVTTTPAPTTTTTTTTGPTQYTVTASGPIDAFGADGTYTFSNLDTNGLPVYGNGNGWYIAFYPVTETAGCWVMGDQNDGPSIYFNYFIASKSDLFESRSPLGLWADNCGGEALDVVVS